MEKSLAQRFLEERKADPDDQSDWIIVYDFIKKKPNPRCWRKLQKMKSRFSLRRIQYSVLFTTQRHEALAAVRLAERYGAEVELFRVEKVVKGGLQYWHYYRIDYIPVFFGDVKGEVLTIV